MFFEGLIETQSGSLECSRKPGHVPAPGNIMDFQVMITVLESTV